MAFGTVGGNEMIEEFKHDNRRNIDSDEDDSYDTK